MANTSHERGEIIEQLRETVLKNRVQQYDDPENSFDVIAKRWQLYVQTRFGVKVDFTGPDVALMQIELKLARLSHNIGHQDSWVDIAGYAVCGGGVILKENRLLDTGEKSAVDPEHNIKEYEERRRQVEKELFKNNHDGVGPKG